MTTPHAARRLKLRGFRRASGLPTRHSCRLAGQRAAVRITSLPGRHAPGALRHLLPPVMGSCLEFGDPDGTVRLRVYISGDTLLIPQLAGIPDRMGELDAAVLHLGGTRLPGGLLVTMTGEQGVDLVQRVRPRAAIASALRRLPAVQLAAVRVHRRDGPARYGRPAAGGGPR